MAEFTESEPIEVQFMDDISCIIGREDHFGTAASTQELLEKLPRSERQITACLGGQSLVHQLWVKCNRLELQLLELRKEFDQQVQVGRSSEDKDLAVVVPEYPGSEVEQEPEPDGELCSSIATPAAGDESSKGGPLENYTNHLRRSDVEKAHALSVTRQINTTAPDAHSKDAEIEDADEEYMPSEAGDSDSSYSYMHSETEEDGKHCPHCGAGFRDFWNLKRHMNSKHKDKDHKEWTLNCKFCGKWFHHLDQLRLHQAVMYPNNPPKSEALKPRELLKDRTCPESNCGKVLSTLSHMERHVAATVHSEPSFMCQYCEKTFGRKDYVKRHQRQARCGRKGKAQMKKIEIVEAEEGKKTGTEYIQDEIEKAERFRMNFDYLEEVDT